MARSKLHLVRHVHCSGAHGLIEDIQAPWDLPIFLLGLSLKVRSILQPLTCLLMKFQIVEH